MMMKMFYFLLLVSSMLVPMPCQPLRETFVDGAKESGFRTSTWEQAMTWTWETKVVEEADKIEMVKIPLQAEMDKFNVLNEMEEEEEEEDFKLEFPASTIEVEEFKLEASSPKELFPAPPVVQEVQSPHVLPNPVQERKIVKVQRKIVNVEQKMRSYPPGFYAAVSMMVVICFGFGLTMVFRCLGY